MSCNVPKNLRCPKCKSLNVIGIGGTYKFNSEGIGKAKEDLNNPLRPLERFECEVCKYKWLNPQFEKYLAVMVGIF